MLRLRIKEFVVANAPELNRFQLGRLANLSHTVMNRIWNKPENTHIYLDTLETVRTALSTYLGRNVSLHELIEEDEQGKSKT